MMLARYQRAEQLLAWNLRPQLKNVAVDPEWISDNAFCYRRQTDQSLERIMVNTRTLTETLVDKSPPADLWQQQHPDKRLSISPDGQQAVFVREHNLFLLERGDNKEKPLTTDGQQHYGYASYPDFVTFGIYENTGLLPALWWSPSQRYLAVQRIDERHVANMPLVQSVPKQGTRPKERTYKMALPDDSDIPLVSVEFIDLETGRIITLDRPPISGALGGLMDTGGVLWGDDGRLYIVEVSRDRKTLRFMGVDPATGHAQIILQETAQSFIYPGPYPLGLSQIAVLPETDRFIWYSQCSGYGHLYLHDLLTGEMINAITTGEYVVTKILKVDMANDRVFFAACGREPDRNPYYEHLYRVNFDGSDLVLLTPDDAQHDIVAPQIPSPAIQIDTAICGIAPDASCFIDTYSRVDLPAKTVLRSTDDGAVLMQLASSEPVDTSVIPYIPPLSFSAKAADGVTDLWGVIYRPSDFDKHKTYPVILCIYGTPHECITPTRYGQTSHYLRDVYRTLAELGCVAIIMDPRGTPFRSKSFHDVAYGNLENGGGIDDQVAVLKQLGEQYAWMDMQRVGITGHSGGGFAAARAMMTYPDFFKVAVASGGNHDLRLNVAGWGEAFQGLLSGDNYDPVANANLAHKLKGKLLLIHGDIDANVHIAHTLKLVDQLIAHNKDFDLLILPNRGHVHAEDTYFIRKLWDYFTEHLLQATPPQQYGIQPPAE